MNVTAVKKLVLGAGAVVALSLVGSVTAMLVSGQLSTQLERSVTIARQQMLAGRISTAAADMIDLDSLARATTFFQGTAREAADRFPQNANVTIVSALAGVGLDRTRVILIADPAAVMNGHRLSAEGDFGRLNVSIDNRPLATNPKSSEMTALNLVRLIENRASPLAR